MVHSIIFVKLTLFFALWTLLCLMLVIVKESAFPIFCINKKLHVKTEAQRLKSWYLIQIKFFGLWKALLQKADKSMNFFSKIFALCVVQNICFVGQFQFAIPHIHFPWLIICMISQSLSLTLSVSSLSSWSFSWFSSLMNWAEE